jgi:hypothetical protein
MNVLLFSIRTRGSLGSLVKRGFEQAGHRVIAFSPERASSEWPGYGSRVYVPRLMAESSPKPDLVVVLENDPRFRFFPDGLLEVPVPTVFWAVDNHLNYRWHKEYARQFDMTFFAQRDYIRAARRYGVHSVRWLPLAADAEYHRIEPRPGKYTVSFVGNVSAGRKKFFDRIDPGIPLNIVTGAYEEEMAGILAESKIGLNVSLREDLNMRFFEVLASGALLVTQKIDAGMSELFQDGVHFVTHNVTDVSGVLKFYLEHESLRADIARRGRELCLSRHTYKHRCQQLIEAAFSDADFLAKRQRRVRSCVPDISEALLFAHPTFRMRDEASESYNRAVRKSRFGTYSYLLKYFASYLGESVRKTFKKTIW